MAKAIALYTGGIHSLKNVAIREDGTVFERFMERGRFGYTWSAWRKTGEVLGHNERHNPPQTRNAGFSTLYLTSENSACINDQAYWKNGRISVRLPN